MAKRTWHYLKPNDTTQTIQSCVFFDTETRQIKIDANTVRHELLFGWSKYIRRTSARKWTDGTWNRFDSTSQFCKYLTKCCRNKVKLYVWCHNTNFDLRVLRLPEALVELGWQLVSAIIDGPPTILHLRRGSKHIVLVDTLNIWRMSLEDLGNKVSLPKFSTPKSLRGSATNVDRVLDPFATDSPSDDISIISEDEYCRRDVEIISRAVTGWAEWLIDCDLGSFQLTAAGQAITAFRHRFMHDRILIDADLDALRVARNSYHGARCEAGRIGYYHDDFILLDVNSMYPYVMHDYEFPLRLRAFKRNIRVEDLFKLLDQYCICAHCRVVVEKPFLAVRHENKLVFPVGEFDAYLTTPDLKYLKEHGSIKWVHECSIYEKGAPFVEYVDYFYSRRLDALRAGQVTESNHFKLLLNAFYGKWGQNGLKYIKAGVCDPSLFETRSVVNFQTGLVHRTRFMGGIVTHILDEAESRESHPAIAAHVTAYARMIIWTLIRQIPPEHYFYCDTDSILISAECVKLFENGLDEHRLGALKKVGQYADITIYGCKDLVLDGKATLKGVRKTAQKIDENTYSQERWSTLVGQLGRRDKAGPITTRYEKHLKRVYDKGIVGRDGIVRPYVFPLDGGVGDGK